MHLEQFQLCNPYKRDSKLGMSKGHHFFNIQGVRKVNLFCQKWYIKG